MAQIVVSCKKVASCYLYGALYQKIMLQLACHKHITRYTFKPLHASSAITGEKMVLKCSYLLNTYHSMLQVQPSELVRVRPLRLLYYFYNNAKMFTNLYITLLVFKCYVDLLYMSFYLSSSHICSVFSCVVYVVLLLK